MANSRSPDLSGLGDDDLRAIVRDIQERVPEFGAILRGLDAIAELRRRRQEIAKRIDCPPEIAAQIVAEFAVEHPGAYAELNFTAGEFERQCRTRFVGIAGR